MVDAVDCECLFCVLLKLSHASSLLLLFVGFALRVTFVPLLFAICRAVVGELDEDMESDINLADIRAEPLNPVVH